MMTEEKGEAVEKESLHHRAERHAIYTVIDAVFGLSLGLGAFSLTELPIAEPQDLFLAIGFFGFSYLRRHKHNSILHRLLHRHPAHTDTHNFDAGHRTNFTYHS
jgi:hypothetical protein